MPTDMTFELEYNCSDLMRDAYVEERDTYEGGDMEEDDELDVEDEEDGEELMWFDFGVGPEFPLSLHVLIMTSSSVCTNSSVFVPRYGFEEEEEAGDV